MTGVSLDASGAVLIPRENPKHGFGTSEQPLEIVRWSGLLPFEQGYVEALFASAGFIQVDRDSGEELPFARFSDLAPETLAAIRKDCAAFGQTWRMQEPERGFAQGEMGGRDFWWMRQQGKLTDPPFPRLAVTLGEDGKVRIAPVDGTTERPSRSGRDQMTNITLTSDLSGLLGRVEEGGFEGLQTPVGPIAGLAP